MLAKGGRCRREAELFPYERPAPPARREGLRRESSDCPVQSESVTKSAIGSTTSTISSVSLEPAGTAWNASFTSFHDLFGPTDARAMYPTTLNALRDRVPPSSDATGRAVDLAPDKAVAQRVLDDVIVRRGNWAGSIDRVERALDLGGGEFQARSWPGLTEYLIRVVAGGHGQRVRQLMEQAGLGEQMEPLWHAVRAELGEDLEPLPVEVMDAVTDIRKRIATRR